MTPEEVRESIVGPHRRHGRLSGRCLCGAVKIEIDGDYVAAVGACHCLMCQRWNGMLFGSFEATAAHVTVEGEVTRHASSSFSERAFCATCGSHLWMRNFDPEETAIELFPGLFQEARDFVLLSEIYTDRAPHYLPLAGDHRRKTRADYEAANPSVEGDAT